MSERDYHDQASRLRAMILVTVYNDWSAFKMLLDELSTQPMPAGLDLQVIAVDDASRENHDTKLAILAWSPLPLTILTLARNVGNQRAIAIGLSHIVTKMKCDFVVVMDGDGEDRPRDVPILLKHLLDHPRSVITAQRHRRSEILSYRLLYAFYKMLFRILTGNMYDFGNFSAMSFNSAEQLCSMHELFLSYPATILSSRVPIERVPIDRGTRYMGRSGMTYLGLAVQALSSIAVFSDRVLARMLVACAGIFGLGLLAVVFAVIAKVAGLATPGWTTTVVGFVLAMLVETAVAILTGMLMVLNSRQPQSVLPLHFAGEFMRFVKQIDYSNRSAAISAEYVPATDALP